MISGEVCSDMVECGGGDKLGRVGSSRVEWDVLWVNSDVVVSGQVVSDRVRFNWAGSDLVESDRFGFGGVCSCRVESFGLGSENIGSNQLGLGRKGSDQVNWVRVW